MRARLAQRLANRLRVGHPLSPHHPEGGFGILIESDMKGTSHANSVLQIVLPFYRFFRPFLAFFARGAFFGQPVTAIGVVCLISAPF